MHKLRQLRLLLRYLLRRPAGDPLRPVVSHFRVTPLDVELTRAVSHAYLAFAGLGRWDWSFHNINWGGFLRERWAPLTHSELVHYRRALSIFARVEVATTLIWWDDKMAYLQHRISCEGRVAAVVYSRGTFYAGRDRVTPARCIKSLPAPPGAKPAIIDVWDRADALFSAAHE